MKVSVQITVDVDPDAWTTNYGIEGAKEIRKDAKEYIDNLVREHLRDLELTTKGA